MRTSGWWSTAANARGQKAAPIVKHMQPTVQKKNTMPNSPNFVPPFPPHITIKKTYQFRIDQDSTRIDNKKSKRNCDTKQQTEALSQPLSSLSKNMVVKTVCVIKNET